MHKDLMLTLNLTGSDQARSYTCKSHIGGGIFFLLNMGNIQVSAQGRKKDMDENKS